MSRLDYKWKRREALPPGDEKERGCLRKQFYATSSEASMIAMRGSSWGRMTAYKCKFCPGWHVAQAGF